jgi:hypothetical protein
MENLHNNKKPQVEDVKPPAQDTQSEKSDSVASPVEGASNSPRPVRNTSEFIHAFNHLHTTDIPAYTRDFDSILTFPEKVRNYCTL